MTLYGSLSEGMESSSSSHSHCPEVEKLKKCPSIAKLLTNATLRPVGCPLSVQLPVSSNTVRSQLTSTTSPVTPLISTQSPNRIPFLPINTNQPRNPTMKSFSATVSPAPASPRKVPSWLGGPKITSKINNTATTWTETVTVARNVCICRRSN